MSRSRGRRTIASRGFRNVDTTFLSYFFFFLLHSSPYNIPGGYEFINGVINSLNYASVYIYMNCAILSVFARYICIPI